MCISFLRRHLPLLAALLLSACTSLPPSQPDADTMFVVLGEGGEPSARLITRAQACPPIVRDGQALPMQVRVPYGAIPVRPGQAGMPATGAVLTCEAALPPGTRSAAIHGRPLPLPVAAPMRIVVIGDTGCRLKGKEFQDCNDAQAFPFAQIAASAAAFQPDLVIHVGDYHYREDPCPPGRPGCAGSPWGYGVEAWEADFFTPARPLLLAAPWVLARGNHESCARAGQGWWRFLDPRPFQPGRDCDAPANDALGDFSDPYAVPLGDDAQLVVFDTAATSYKGLAVGDPRRAAYNASYRKLAALARGARYNIGVDHHPLFGFGASRDPVSGAITLFGGDRGLHQAFGDLDPGLLPASFGMLLSGHVHLWEQVSFASAHPTQFVSGFSGTAEDIVPLPAVAPAGQQPAPGAIVEAMSSWIDGFGFMTLERTGRERWQARVWDRHGRLRNTCSVEGRRSRCALARVE